MNLKTNLDEFISHWDKEAEELKRRQITEDDSYEIEPSFNTAKARLLIFALTQPDFSLSDFLKLDLTASKLMASLAIARSNYRSKHKTLLERLFDSLGKIRIKPSLINIGKEKE